ncbi:MAG: hypothetical protein JWQ09_463 [Segetibacter sp.]|nr:hypothetical protein [Segetibacter sp.]
MPLSWNEIKSRALQFTQEWKDEVSEDAEAKSFWDDFFNVFGISRRRVATFEQAVNLTPNPSPEAEGKAPVAGFPPSPSERAGVRSKQGFIDLLWKGVILIEHKSRGKDLEKAYKQAKDYFPGLTEKELPRYILVSDFERFKLYDLEDNQQYEFKLSQLVDHVHLFGFIAGYQKRTYKEQDPVNIEAAELMGRLHDKLKDIGYEGHALELYLVRLVFLLFADDTNIFEKGIFYDYLDLNTKEDGSDLAAQLAHLYEVLNTPKEKRLRNINESLNAFPYVNGKLFEEHLPTAAFDSQMRKILMDCCLLDWGKISPAIFGSLFQSVMDAKARRNLGAHYTSEKNILKLIKPLFLDELYTEYNSVKDSKQKLKNFHDKISRLRFLDPACGCGNFLIIAYRELRLLEIEIIKQRLKLEGYREEVLREAKMDVGYLVQCDVDKFYGIEYEEFPAQIAQVAMWLADHQMNQLVSNTFGEYYVRLPLRKSATIKHGNALRTDWQSLIEPSLGDLWDGNSSPKGGGREGAGQPKYDYILGNPPFIGKTWQTPEQRADIDLVLQGVNGAGVLDYVTAWYIKAAKYMQEYNFMDQAEDTSIEQPLRRTLVQDNNGQLTKTAFVSTNSISQGEQVGILWNELFNKYKVKIHFAHRTFSWSNEARGNAAVHVVIVGFANFDSDNKKVFEYNTIKGEPHEVKVKNINPYLVEGKDGVIVRRSSPINSVPKMIWGNKPVDGGHLIIDDEELEEFLQHEPLAKKYIKKFVGGSEFINNKKRWCLWLVDVNPVDLKKMPRVLERIQKVKEIRLQSTDVGARRLAEFPSLFRDKINPKSFIAIPEVSTERRKYIPIGFLNDEVIVSNKIQMIPNGEVWHFGVLTSEMHMTWMRQTCGRMKSDFSYSNSIVYNNFPWPENPTEKQVQAVEAAAQNVLDARAQFPNASLAALYDPNTMPPVLVKAHQVLDKAVDLCYRPQPFINETKRIEFLFELYDKYTSGMFGEEKKKGKKV